MRDPKRLNTIYIELMEIHKSKAPDIRFGQLMCGFTHWLDTKYKKDIFYVGDDQILKLMKEYLRVEE